jgi:hypothetical protein
MCAATAGGWVQVLLLDHRCDGLTIRDGTIALDHGYSLLITGVGITFNNVCLRCLRTHTAMIRPAQTCLQSMHFDTSTIVHPEEFVCTLCPPGHHCGCWQAMAKAHRCLPCARG